MYRFLILTTCIFVCFLARADNGNITKNSDQIDFSNINQAKKLGLTIEELKKYNEIMNSPLAFFYKRGEQNIFYVLAAEADSEKERMKFAKKWVEAEKDYHEKLGKALNAYTKASYEIFGINPQVFNLKAFNNAISGVDKFSPLTRKKIYVKIQGCSECEHKFKQLLVEFKSQKIAGIDVYFVGNEITKELITRWAMRLNISRTMVSSKSITLNYDDHQSGGDLPYVKEVINPT